MLPYYLLPRRTRLTASHYLLLAIYYLLLATYLLLTPGTPKGKKPKTEELEAEEQEEPAELPVVQAVMVAEEN